MNEETLDKILLMVSCGTTYESVLDSGYTYSQLALMLKEVIARGYVKMSDHKFQLTIAGENTLCELSNNKHGSNKWILSNQMYYTNPIDKYDIILPDKFLV